MNDLGRPSSLGNALTDEVEALFNRLRPNPFNMNSFSLNATPQETPGPIEPAGWVGDGAIGPDQMADPVQWGVHGDLSDSFNRANTSETYPYGGLGTADNGTVWTTILGIGNDRMYIYGGKAYVNRDALSNQMTSNFMLPGSITMPLDIRYDCGFDSVTGSGQLGVIFYFNGSLTHYMLFNISTSVGASGLNASWGDSADATSNVSGQIARPAGAGPFHVHLTHDGDTFKAYVWASGSEPTTPNLTLSRYNATPTPIARVTAAANFQFNTAGSFQALWFDSLSIFGLGRSQPAYYGSDYSTLVATADGVTSSWTLPYPTAYVPGSLVVYVDGVRQTAVEDDPAAGSFSLSWVPAMGDYISAQWRVPAVV